MVSTQANTHQTPRRPKNKIRTKRTKRRVGRRMAATAASSDSKSSLENAEGPIGASLTVSDDVVIEPVVKKRSVSEERKPCRVKIGQRSSSLQLDAVTQPARRQQQQQQQQQQPTLIPKKKNWFFSWPVRLVVPNRTTIEDEGFDSFHGNNSSSSDCENDENAPPPPPPPSATSQSELTTSDKVVDGKTTEVLDSSVAGRNRVDTPGLNFVKICSNHRMIPIRFLSVNRWRCPSAVVEKAAVEFDVHRSEIDTARNESGVFNQFGNGIGTAGSSPSEMRHHHVL